MKTKCDLDKIKFSTDSSTFKKAVGLYEGGKVTHVEEGPRSYTAVVIGTKPYTVTVDTRDYDYGQYTCYLGQNDILCKHMVALALYVVKSGEPLADEDKKQIHSPACSNKVGTLNDKELLKVKKTITGAFRYIKPYTGPSRMWFAYQNTLEEGCNRLSAIISCLPVDVATAALLIDLLLRLDKRLSVGGVDDSNGTVGGFMEEVVNVLKDYAKIDTSCMKVFQRLEGKETCFGWEEPLLPLTKKNS